MRPRQIGLIGLGYWGSKYLRLLREMPGVELAFVADVDRDRLHNVGPYTSIPQYYDVRAAIEANRIDGVIVATPASTHRRVVQECLEKEVQVLVEKPLATSMADALFLAHLSREKNTLLYPGHVYAHNDAVRALAKWVSDGALGGLRYVTCQRTGLGPVRGDVNVLWDLVPHDLTILDLLGLGKPESITSIGTSFLQHGIEDIAFSTLRYNGGAITHIQASWLDPYKVRRVTVVGSKRMALLDDVATEDRLRIYEHGVDVLPTTEYGEFKTQVRSGDVRIPFISNREPLRNMVETFLHAHRNTESTSDELVRGLSIVAVLETMNQSMHSNGSMTMMDWTRLEEFTETVKVS